MTAGANPSPAATRDSRGDRYVTVDGARLRFRDAGNGPPVVLLHGWTLDLEMWNPQVSALCDDFRLVCLDRRGHGLSGGQPDLSRDAPDVAALCAHLGLGAVALIGMSQGARGAFAFASAAPQQVCALILDGPPDLGGSGLEDDVPLERYRRLVRSEGIEAFRRAWTRSPLMRLRTEAAAPRELLAAMIARYAGEDLKGEAPQPAPLLVPESVRVPTLIINGAHDLPGRLTAGQRLAARLHCAERALIAAAGHLPNLDDPVAYHAHCRAFLVRHAGRSTAS